MGVQHHEPVCTPHGNACLCPPCSIMARQTGPPNGCTASPDALDYGDKSVSIGGAGAGHALSAGPGWQPFPPMFPTLFTTSTLNLYAGQPPSQSQSTCFKILSLLFVDHRNCRLCSRAHVTRMTFVTRIATSAAPPVTRPSCKVAGVGIHLRGQRRAWGEGSAVALCMVLGIFQPLPGSRADPEWGPRAPETIGRYLSADLLQICANAKLERKDW